MRTAIVVIVLVVAAALVLDPDFGKRTHAPTTPRFHTLISTAAPPMVPVCNGFFATPTAVATEDPYQYPPMV